MRLGLSVLGGFRRSQAISNSFYAFFDEQNTSKETHHSTLIFLIITLVQKNYIITIPVIMVYISSIKIGGSEYD